MINYHYISILYDFIVFYTALVSILIYRNRKPISKWGHFLKNILAKDLVV